jgi:hypothetical protein
MNKNWPTNPCVGCLKPIDLAYISEVESNLTKESDVGFGDEVECEEFSNVHDTFYIMM